MKNHATQVIQVLRSAGHAAVLAGGCVRDLLLDLEPHDYDIATSATPDQVESLFPHTIAVGKSFGVVVVVMGDHQFEVATFRKDGYSSDSRRPDSVTFTSMREDALRRDFTINAMFMDPDTGEVIDYVGGRQDIADGVLRFVGNPDERIAEDRLRMLRFVRFASRFNLLMSPYAVLAIQKHARTILSVSPERIAQEFQKMFSSSQTSRALSLLKDTGLLHILLPEVEAMIGVAQPPQFHPEGDVYQHTLQVLLRLDDNPHSFELGFAALLHDIGKPSTQTFEDRIRFNGHAEQSATMARAVCERLKLSNSQTEHIVWLVQSHMMPMNAHTMRKSRLKTLLASPYIDDFLALHRADCLGSHGKLDNYDFISAKLVEFRAQGSLPPPLITGQDLIAEGFTPGPKFKTMLNAAREAQLEGEISTKEQALWVAKSAYLLDTK